MEDIVQLIAKTYGIVGLLIMLPVFASVFLWRENKRLISVITDNSETSNRHIQACNDQVVEAQKQRVGDAQAISLKLMSIVAEQSASSRDTNNALDRITEILDDLIKTRTT